MANLSVSAKGWRVDWRRGTIRFRGFSKILAILLAYSRLVEAARLNIRSRSREGGHRSAMWHGCRFLLQFLVEAVHIRRLLAVNLHFDAGTPLQPTVPVQRHIVSLGHSDHHAHAKDRCQ